MIHDPEIRVECDGCGNDVTILPSFNFGKGRYECGHATTESAIDSMGWICRDGKQFCCERCANKDL